MLRSYSLPYDHSFPSLFLVSLSAGIYLFQGLLLEEGIVQLLVEVLERCYDATYPSENRVLEYGIVSESSVVQWCIPVFRSISLLCDSQVPLSCFQKKEL